MADNVNVTEGSGTVVAADEITINAVAVKAQRVKIAVGEDGEYVGDLDGRNVDGDTNSSAIFVDPRLSVVRVSATPTVSTSAYSVGDVVGTLMEFTNVVRATGGSGRVEAVQIVDLSDQQPEMDLILFDRSVDDGTDNATFDAVDGDLSYCVGVVTIGGGSYATFNDNAVAAINNVGLSFVSNGTSIFGLLIARSTPTLTSTSDLVVTLTVTRD